jgi:hypothetical protein
MAEAEAARAQATATAHREGGICLAFFAALARTHGACELCRVQDVLLHNSDRHHGHFLLGQHWVEGHWDRGTWNGDMHPVRLSPTSAQPQEVAASTPLHPPHHRRFGRSARAHC